MRGFVLILVILSSLNNLEFRASSIQVQSASFYSIVAKSDGAQELRETQATVEFPIRGGFATVALAEDVAKSSNDPWLVIRYQVGDT